METKLFYEKTEVSIPEEVKAAYEYAVSNNIKFYRAVSKTGTYYGYLNGRAVRAEDGQEWFENPEYKEPAVTGQVTAEVTLKTAPQTISSAATSENTTDLSVLKEAVQKKINTLLQYKRLYETAADERDMFKKKFEEARGELDAIKADISSYAKEILAENK